MEIWRLETDSVHVRTFVCRDSADVRRIQRVVEGLRLHVPAEHRLAVGISVQVSAVCRVRYIAHGCRSLQNPAGGSGHGSAATCRCQRRAVGMGVKVYAEGSW